MTTKRKVRTLKELERIKEENDEEPILSPKITPDGEENSGMQGITERSNTDSPRAKRRLRRHSISEKTHTISESGTCNVCSAPSSSCIHMEVKGKNNISVETSKGMVSDETSKANFVSHSSINNTTTRPRGRPRKDQNYTASITSKLTASSSHDSISENAESKAVLLPLDTSPEQKSRDYQGDIISCSGDNIANIPGVDLTEVGEKKGNSSIIKAGANMDHDHIKAEEVKPSDLNEKIERSVILQDSDDGKSSVPANEDDDSDIYEDDVKVCDICGDAGREESLAFCSRCTDGAEHTYCMRKMLNKVPESDWLCEECKVKEDVSISEQKKGKKVSESFTIPSQMEKSQTSGSTDSSKNLPKGDNKHESELLKGITVPNFSPKRCLDNSEVTSVVKRQAKETNIECTKPALSKEPSFKSIDMGKYMPTHPIPSSRVHSGLNSSDIVKSAIASAYNSSKFRQQHQIPRGTYLKSNSFNRPKVKLVDEDVLPKNKLLSSKSVLMRSSSSHLSTVESKVKAGSSNVSRPDDIRGIKAKDSKLSERMHASKSDRALTSPKPSSVGYPPKAEAKVASHVENISMPSPGTKSDDLKTVLNDKVCLLSKTTNVVSTIVSTPTVVAERRDFKRPSSFSFRRGQTPSLPGNSIKSNDVIALPSPRKCGMVDERAAIAPRLRHDDLSLPPLSTEPVPHYDFIWHGGFEIYRGGVLMEFCDGIQAHLSTFASSKVPKAVSKLSFKLLLEEVPRITTWPSQFGNHATEVRIALYFFARDFQSLTENYQSLMDSMMKNDLALKGSFDGIELLIFPSNQLPEKSQRWNDLFFLWGVFRVLPPADHQGKFLEANSVQGKTALDTCSLSTSTEIDDQIITVMKGKDVLTARPEDKDVLRYEPCSDISMQQSVVDELTTASRKVFSSNSSYSQAGLPLTSLDKHETSSGFFKDFLSPKDAEKVEIDLRADPLMSNRKRPYNFLQCVSVSSSKTAASTRQDVLMGGDEYKKMKRSQSDIIDSNSSKERFRFPFDLNPLKESEVVSNSISVQVISSDDDDEVQHKVPNLNLALGDDMESFNKGQALSLFSENKIHDNPVDITNDNLPASLSLSLAVPASGLIAKSDQVLPERFDMNTSIFLFGQKLGTENYCKK